MAKKAKKKPNKAMYLMSPNTCPYCNSNQLEAGEINYDDILNHITECLDCGEPWQDFLTVTDVDFSVKKEDM